MSELWNANGKANHHEDLSIWKLDYSVFGLIESICRYDVRMGYEPSVDF